MSGEAGAELASQYYSIFIGTGVSEDVAVPPDADDDYLGRHFAEASGPYEQWLARARADLDALFVRIVAEGRLPLLPIATPADAIDGAIAGGQPLAVQIGGYGKIDPLGSLNLSLVVSTRVAQAALDAALEEVANVLRAHRPTETSFLSELS